MKKHLVTLMAMLALTTWVASAADIDGKWTRQQQGRGGGDPTTQTLTIKSSGATFTGTMDAGRGGPTDIKEGKIDGANVSFKITQAGRDGNPQDISYTGTVTATELTLTRAGGGGGGGKGGDGKGGGGGGGGRGAMPQVWTKAK